MKLLDQVRDAAARRHLAQATIECYLMWIVHFLQFCKQGDRWRDTTSGRCRRCWAHASLKTTMIYTHVMNKPAVAVVSPLDQISTGLNTSAGAGWMEAAAAADSSRN